MTAPKKYPDELRERAVRLYRESDPRPTFRTLAQQLGVHHEALRSWVRQAEADTGERHDRPSTDMLAENRRLAKENAELRRGQRGPARGERLFRLRDRPDPEVVMSFVDAHGFPAGLVLRVLGVPVSTYYDWRTRRANPLSAPPRRRRAPRTDREDPLGQRVRHRLRIPAGLARAAPPRRARRPQARRADHARARPAGRPPAPRLEGRLDPAEPRPPAGAGPARTRLHPRPRRTGVWVADLTRIVTGEGVLWMASVA
ncbi:Mobile element protein [Pseudonocardia sp. Ae717_Ps2]|nr:Mobile element protein [Pseudonocardia sp. Ae717_Ps2]